MLPQDLRHAVRLLGRAPGFTAAVILTLALGIGMTTAIFSVVDAVLLRPVPLPDADRLVMIWETDRDSGTSREPGAWPDFVDFQERSRRVDRFAGFIAGETTLTPDRGDPVRLAGLFVTHEFFRLAGARPLVGRLFTPEEDRVGGPALAVISERLWTSQFNRDAAVIGRAIRLDDRPRTVVGVVPAHAGFGVLQMLSAADYARGFADRDPRSQVDVYVPLQADPKRLVRDTHPLLMFGRLATSATVSAAQEELAAIAFDLERTYPSNQARGVSVEPLTDVIFGPTRGAMLVLLAAVGLVLLIAGVNVANLLLVRATGRQREVAVRTALGADFRALAKQFVVETTLLTGVAAALGILAAFLTLRVLVALAPPAVPRLASVGLDARVLLVTLAVSAVMAVVLGLLPVLQARHANLQGWLGADDTRGATSGRQAGLARSALVVAEIALAVVLVCGAGLLIKSLWRIQQIDPGFDASGVLKAEFQLPASRYPFQDPGEGQPPIERFNSALLNRVSALPGVTAAAVAGNHPLSAGYTNSFRVVGREAESENLPELSMRGVTPTYFRVVRLALDRGRLLEDTDGGLSPRVMVINEAAAARVFPARDPIGQQLAFYGARWTIVGVVRNERFHGLTAEAPIAGYLPLAQAPSRGGQSLIVRSSGDPLALAAPVRAAFADLDRGLAVYGVETLTDAVDQSIGTERFLALLLAAFAAFALLLAAIGIHGVLSYSVACRTREIGIRLALGASNSKVAAEVLGHGVRLTVLGLAGGFGLAVLFGRALAGLLYGVSPTDGATFATVLVVLAAVALIATWLSARRALGVDPLEAMRMTQGAT